MSRYIYFQDSCVDRHECSHCGEPVFAHLGRRESPEEWIKAIQTHQDCQSPEESGTALPMFGEER